MLKQAEEGVRIIVFNERLHLASGIPMLSEDACRASVAYGPWPCRL